MLQITKNPAKCKQQVGGTDYGRLNLACSLLQGIGQQKNFKSNE
jgi:hypothetical protein